MEMAGDSPSMAGDSNGWPSLAGGAPPWKASRSGSETVSNQSNEAVSQPVRPLNGRRKDQCVSSRKSPVNLDPRITQGCEGMGDLFIESLGCGVFGESEDCSASDAADAAGAADDEESEGSGVSDPVAGGSFSRAGLGCGEGLELEAPQEVVSEDADLLPGARVDDRAIHVDGQTGHSELLDLLVEQLSRDNPSPGPSRLTPKAGAMQSERLRVAGRRNLLKRGGPRFHPRSGRAWKEPTRAVEPHTPVPPRRVVCLARVRGAHGKKIVAFSLGVYSSVNFFET
jgi:hypothetical protein